MIILGVDLAAPGRARTGVAVLNVNDNTMRCHLIDSATIATHVLMTMPDLIAIDSPLSLPRGGLNRDIEVKARRLGLRLLPPLLGPMRRLTKMGILIRELCESLGIEVVEVHPTSSLRSMGINREQLVSLVLRRFKVEADVLNRHVVDSIVCALTGLAYVRSLCFCIRSDQGDGFLVVADKRLLELLSRG